MTNQSRSGSWSSSGVSLTNRSSGIKRGESLAVTRSTSSGGTVTVSRGGRIITRDASGRIIQTDKVNRGTARNYVESEAAKIKQETDIKNAARGIENLLSVSRGLEGGGQIIVTRDGVVTKFDKFGRQTEQFRTNKTDALKFMRGESQKIKDVMEYNRKIAKERQALLRQSEASDGVKTKSDDIIRGELKEAPEADYGSLSGIKKELNTYRDKIMQEIEKSRAKDTSSLGTAKRIFKGVVVLGVIGVAKGIIGVDQTIAHPIETAKGIASAVRHPIQTVELIGKDFSVDPVGTIAEFYTYGKTIQLLGKGVKKGLDKTGLAAKAKETLFVKSQPIKIQGATKKIIAATSKSLSLPKIKKVDFVKVQGLTKIEGRALLKAISETETLRIKIKPKGLSRTPTPVNVDIATSSFTKLAKNFQKQLPKSIRNEYIVRGNSLIRQTTGTSVFRVNPLRNIVRKLRITKKNINQINWLKPKIAKKKGIYTFQDIQTGKIRNFKSKTLYNKAVQAQAKFLKTAKGQTLLKKLQSAKTQPSRLALEKERIFLRKQLKIEKKLAAGQQVKAPRATGVTLKGKKVYPFEDIRTGKTRYFTSRKTWLKAVKQQVKFLNTKEGIKLNVKLQRIKTQPARLALQKERMLLRRQQKIETKLAEGQSIKAERAATVTLNGKKVYPFRDLKTGIIRYFTSRKTWLRAVKQQSKAKKTGLIDLEQFFSTREKVDSVVKPKFIKFKDRINIVDKKGKTLLEVKKVSESKSGVSKKTGGVIETKSGQQLLLKEVKNVQKKVIDLEKLLKKPKLSQLQAQAIKRKVKTTTRQILVLEKRIKALGESKPKQAIGKIVKLLASLKPTLNEIPDILTLRLNQQQKKLSVAQTLKLEPVLRVPEAIIERGKIALRTGQAARIKPKVIPKVTAKIRELIKTQVKTKTKPIPKIKLREELKKRKLEKKIKDKIKKRKFIYIPDLYSAVYGVESNLKEKKAFLKKDRVFTGVELRKLI